MAVYADNILQQVQTYQRASLGLLQNECCFVSTANTKFKNFQNMAANLGSVVTFDLPPRFNTTSGLVAAWQGANQRQLQLACSQSANTSFTVTDQQRVFNLENGADDYIRVFGKSAVANLAATIETDIALNCVSGVTNAETAQLNTYSGPYRYYGDGNTTLSSYQQLATAVQRFKNYGAVKDGIKFYLPDTVVPAIIGNGLGQFAPNRNNEDAMSWSIGSFGAPPVEYYQSNLLPEHVAGTVGVEAATLTLISTNDPTGQNVTQLTFSGATANDTNAIFAGDLFEFNDGVSGHPNMRYLVFIGQTPSSNLVQVRATANAAANGSGNVTINITPALNWAGGANVNLNHALEAGMQVTVLPSHKAGLILGGDAMFIAMPQLPNERPYDTANEVDPETGVSIRLSYGSIFGQNQTGFINSAFWGSVIVPEYSMRVIVPMSQA